jgi:cell division protein FtsI (penicillin-binding protein 3)
VTPKQTILIRVYLSFLFVAGFAVVIMVYACKISFNEGKHWAALADSLSTNLRTISATRGNIYAADGSLLATSVPVYDIAIDTKADGLLKEVWRKNADSLALMLSLTFQDHTKKEYLKILNAARTRNVRYLPLQKKITYQELKYVKQFPIFRLGKNKGGLIIEEHDIRDNPFEILAFRTIGYYRDDSSSVGLEAAFNKDLKGRDGKRLMQKIVGGHWMPLSDDNDIEPKNGFDIYTTLDINIQDAAESALAKALEKHDASHGCVILMETQTGRIKAIANLTRKDGKIVEDKNYALSEITEPGSTFKLATVLSLLEDNLVTDQETVETGGGTIKVADNVTIRDAEEGGHGNLTLKQSFIHSSNVAFAQFVTKHYRGKESRFANHLINDFKLGESLHLGIPGEGVPKIKHPQKNKDWSDASLPEMAIGYEVLVTPMQTLTLYNAIANGGKMVRPQFVSRIEQTGKVIKDFPVEVISEHIVSANTLKRVMPMLIGVVEEGTAKALKNSIYSIGGKTGTARIVEDGHYVEKYKSSFVGFFPADKPQFTCMVMIFRPLEGGYYGATVAGPVFREIADKVYATCINRQPEQEDDSLKEIRTHFIASGSRTDFLTVQRQLGISSHEVANSSAEWVENNIQVKQSNLKEISSRPDQMPNLSGMSLKDAIYILENKGLRVKYTGKGKVQSQSIDRGSKIYKGLFVELKLG